MTYNVFGGTLSLTQYSILNFLKSIKSVLILVQSNTSMSKNYVAYSYVTIVCMIG